MPVDYNFQRGVDLPSWHWLTPFPSGPSNPGTASAYDGTRYIYWAIQYGSTATTASTSQLWRYDTWTNGWQYLSTLTSGNQGIDIEHDPVRNVLWIIYGASLTEWRYFNLNMTSITLAGLTTNAWTISAAISVVLPAAASIGSSLTMRNDLDLPDVFDEGTTVAGATATSIATALPATFQIGIIGLQIRFTSGALSGQKRIVTGVTNATTLTVTRAFSAAPAVGDAWVIELPSDTAVSGTTTTLVTPGGMGTNAFANADVVIVSGTGAGQRKRVASNDATTLTLAAAVAGATRTGPFSPAPDATSVYKLVPSSDFLYYMRGNNGTGFDRIDVTATTLAWASMAALPAASGGGGNLLHPHAGAPFRILAIRGNGQNSIFLYDPGPNTWATLNTAAFASETFSTGASSCIMHGKRKIFFQKEGNARCYTYDIATGAVDSAGFMPYANPSSYEGKRARFVSTDSGVDWVYLLRAGGQEFFRVPVEWL